MEVFLGLAESTAYNDWLATDQRLSEKVGWHNAPPRVNVSFAHVTRLLLLTSVPTIVADVDFGVDD